MTDDSYREAFPKGWQQRRLKGNVVFQHPPCSWKHPRAPNHTSLVYDSGSAVSKTTVG
jgi:hypothetical protein